MKKLFIAHLIWVPTILLNGCYAVASPNSYYYTPYYAVYPSMEQQYANYGWVGGYRPGWYCKRTWGHQGPWGYGRGSYFGGDYCK